MSKPSLWSYWISTNMMISIFNQFSIGLDPRWRGSGFSPLGLLLMPGKSHKFSMYISGGLEEKFKQFNKFFTKICKKLDPGKVYHGLLQRFGEAKAGKWFTEIQAAFGNLQEMTGVRKMKSEGLISGFRG